MRNKKLWLTSCILAAGLTMNIASCVSAEDAETGDLIFAQCEEYINVRSEADENSEVVAKLYNDAAATVEETEDNGWYKITSGNAVGYVKAEYFATGEKAQEIASQVGYNVAVVNAEALNIRTAPSEESDVIDVAGQSDELEVVDTSEGWATVALGNDVYGFIHPDYCQYKTYYPTAVTLEEEAAREAALRRAEEAKAQAAEQSSAEGTTYEETAETDASYVEETPETDTAYTETPETDTSYTEVPETDTPYTEAPETDAPYTEVPETETDAPYTEVPETETDAPYTEAPETDAPYTEAPETDTPYTETPDTSSDSSLGQAIANYAVQFVGNPYVYGGTSLTNGTDCSGFTQSVMANFGIYLARTAADQSYGGTSVSISDIQPGDLLFYSDGGGISHVAMYIGGGQIVHAATESQGIIISNYNYDAPVCAARYW